jgi:hypothetical protein
MALLLAFLTWALLTDVPSADPPIIINAKFQPDVQAKVGSLRFYVGEARITDEIPVSVSQTIQLTCRPVLDEGKFPKDRDIGDFTIELTDRDFNIPADAARQIRIRPLKLRIEYARLIDKVLPIQVSADDVADKPRHGFRVDAVRANPPQIQVRLPANRVSDLASLAIKPIRVWQRTASFTSPGEINGELPEQKEVRALEPFYVEVDISPVQFQMEKADVPVFLSTPPLKDHTAALAEPRAVRVILEGPKEIVETIRADQLHVYARLEWSPASRPGNLTLPLKCDIADEALRRSVKIKLHPDEKPQVLVRVTRN